MNQFLPDQQSPGLLFLTLGVVICLTLLINVSFKIIQFHEMTFSINSLICPLTASFYLLALRKCSIKEQRHLLNVALMTLYIFCIGVYILINLPAAESMHGNPVYQIVFDDIPKKFFAVTAAFALSFYLPHLLLCNHSNSVSPTPKQCMLLALLGGFSFFILTFFLLFSGVRLHNIQQIMIDSTLIASLSLLLVGIFYLIILLKYPPPSRMPTRENELFPLCYYLMCFAIVIMLICLACEYRIVAFINKKTALAASAIFFPVTLIISNLIGELWGYRVNLKYSVAIIATQVMFDLFLMGLVALPSPDFCNLNTFYNFIMIRRLPATFLTLFATYLSNAILLHYLKQRNIQRALRVLTANVCANSLLCLIDYTLLFGGIYPYDQIISLVMDVWQYKFFMTLLSIPLVLKLCTSFEKNKAVTWQSSNTARG